MPAVEGISGDEVVVAEGRVGLELPVMGADYCGGRSKATAVGHRCAGRVALLLDGGGDAGTLGEATAREVVADGLRRVGYQRPRTVDVVAPDHRPTGGDGPGVAGIADDPTLREVRVHS